MIAVPRHHSRYANLERPFSIIMMYRKYPYLDVKKYTAASVPKLVLLSGLLPK